MRRRNLKATPANPLPRSARLEGSGVEPVEVEPEVARIGLAVGCDHHVVGVPGGPGGQLAVADQLAVGLPADVVVGVEQGVLALFAGLGELQL